MAKYVFSSLLLMINLSPPCQRKCNLQGHSAAGNAPKKNQAGKEHKNTFGLKSSLSLVPAMMYFLSGETRSMLTLKVSHTLTLDLWVKFKSASVHTEPWLVPTWGFHNEKYHEVACAAFNMKLDRQQEPLTIRNQLLFTLHCSSVQCGDEVGKDANSWPV